MISKDFLEKFDKLTINSKPCLILRENFKSNTPNQLIELLIKSISKLLIDLK